MQMRNLFTTQPEQPAEPEIAELAESKETAALTEEHKVESKESLPMGEIMASLSVDEARKIAMVNHNTYGIFAQNVAAYEENERQFEEVNKLLLHLARGEEVEAKAMIDTNPDLLFLQGNVTDYSDREFISIYPIELIAACEAYDLGIMLVNACPEDKRHLLKEQYDNFHSHEWKKWKHLLSDPESKEEEYASLHKQATNKLSTLLQEYIKNYNRKKPRTPERREELFREALKFGEAEIDVPAETRQIILRGRRQDGSVYRQLSLPINPEVNWSSSSPSPDFVLGKDWYISFHDNEAVDMLRYSREVAPCPAPPIVKRMAATLADACRDRTEKAIEFEALLNASNTLSLRL